MGSERNLRSLLGLSPPAVVVAGYLLYTFVGWALLSVPLAQEQVVAAIDTLFIAASAVSTTGLVTVDPGSTFTMWGELLILVLIQLGGIGYMTFGSVIVVAARHKLSKDRVRVARTTFALPKDFRTARFLRRVVVFSLVTESIGALLLWLAFRDAEVTAPLWSAIFHSVSAFCTAGFSLFSTSLADFRGDVYVNLVIATLSYLGALGFIIATDVWEKFRGKRDQMHFTSIVILRVTLLMSIFATLAFAILEESLQALPPWERLLAAFFQVMSASTTVGFNTVDVGSMLTPMLMLLYFLMVFGASPSGTGGGLKSTTLAALYALVRCTLTAKEKIAFLGREISPSRMRVAAASLTFYAAVLFVAVLLLTALETAPFEAIVFEAISALGTVGLSMGITSDLTPLGKLLIIMLMLAGRAGILTIGVALSLSHEEDEQVIEDSDPKDTELVF